MDILMWIATLILLAAVIVAGAWVYMNYFADRSSKSGFFGGGKEKRLGVVEQSALDGRRRLVLIRRDGVEHLIMTGGPVDVVIETGIGGSGSNVARRDGVDREPPSFSRQPRGAGQSASES